MPKFRKKLTTPVVVDAWQYDGPVSVGMDEPLPNYPDVMFLVVKGPGERWPVVRTPDRATIIGPGDWIITEPGGRLSVKNTSDFEATYDPVEE